VVVAIFYRKHDPLPVRGDGSAIYGWGA